MKLSRVLDLKIFWYWIFYFLIIALFVFYFVEIKPWVNSFSISYLPNAPYIGSNDTYVYWTHAMNYSLSNMPFNMLGPTLTIKLLKSFDLILIFNLGLLFFALYHAYVYLQINMVKLAVLLLINPMIMFQFLVPGKEAPIFISLIFVIIFCQTQKPFHFLTAVCIAMFSKVEFISVIMIFFALFRLKNSYKWSCLGIIILLATIFYRDLPGMAHRTDVLMAGQNQASNGIMVLLHELSYEHYLFPLVVIPKTLINLFEGFNSVLLKGHSLPIDYYILASCTCFLVLCLKNFFKLKFSDNQDEILLLIIFTVMVSTVPFPHHRYILPTYVVLVMMSARASKEKLI